MPSHANTHALSFTIHCHNRPRVDHCCQMSFDPPRNDFLSLAVSLYLPLSLSLLLFSLFLSQCIHSLYIYLYLRHSSLSFFKNYLSSFLFSLIIFLFSLIYIIPSFLLNSFICPPRFLPLFSSFHQPYLLSSLIPHSLTSSTRSHFLFSFLLPRCPPIYLLSSPPPIPPCFSLSASLSTFL